MSFPSQIVIIVSIMMFSPFPSFTTGDVFLALFLVVVIVHVSEFLRRELSKYALILSPFRKISQVILKQNINNVTTVPTGYV